MKSKDQIKEINKLDEPYDLEQYSCKNVLKILDVPEGAYTSTDEVVIGIGETLTSNHRKITQTTKLVIVKFVSHKVQSLVYKVRTKLKDICILASQEDEHISINETLTNYCRELFRKANKIKKDNSNAWQ